MAFVVTQPETLAGAAGDLARIGSAVATMNEATWAPITGVVPPAADQVSVLTALEFAAYGQLYRMLSVQAEQVLDAFVATLRDSAGSYALTEAANTVVAGG
ncbi:PE family protein [Mycobacterium botniense]|uniref:PE family protein PE13 n=1 Tax=Mycobacterium botniense TaxID=84962 RepID=A0A7I9XVJ7_9MYCO|nr:PE family protein [Mycobacterium botniense]GFG73807.1 PE family protein PE13 [Mycobacterium botniense]